MPATSCLSSHFRTVLQQVVVLLLVHDETSNNTEQTTLLSRTDCRMSQLTGHDKEPLRTETLTCMPCGPSGPPGP